jgi:DNA-binding transcriptional ArsR family regulator
MDTISGAALAGELRTSIPRIVRAVERLGIEARQANGRLSLTPPQAERVRRELGVLPSIEGLRQSETAALAALRSAPLGLVSARAVARRAVLSPTAASNALKSLLGKGLVSRNRETLASGRAKDFELWRANVIHPRWPQLDRALDAFRAPQRHAATNERVPPRLRHLFWNTAESQLDVEHGGAYIARRLLQTMDLEGLAWAAQTLDPDDWLRAARGRGLDARVRSLAQNMAAEAEQ